MYLKRLEMKGFKSFADRTVVDFKNGVTCVVGPNGSGKSNITDAVRWVLGEQKIKTLRGAKMEDVIFNGTRRRKALGFAEVSLCFDNSDQLFPLDYEEVTVSRKLFRSGESEYQVNGTSCKLKEIRELFMDTGMGTDGYSIIGQGRIERILSNNKEERRLIFEEASGIVKYKTRKREAERKLENTDQNLARVEDIVRELSGRVEPLRIESEKAKQYKELSEQLKDIEINQFISNYERTEDRLNSEIERNKVMRGMIEGHENALKDLRDAYQLETDKFESSNLKLDQLKEEFFEKMNGLKALEGEKNLIEEKKNNLLENQKRLTANIDAFKVALEEKNTLLANLEADKENLLAQQGNLNQSKADIENEFASVRGVFEDREKEIESKRYRIIDLLNVIERLKGDIENDNRMVASFEERRKELDDLLLESIERIQEINRAFHVQEDALNEIKEKTAQMETEKGQMDYEIRQLREEIESVEAVIKTTEADITKKTSEFEILSSLEEAYDGFDRSVKMALKRCQEDPKMGKGIIDVVASLISVEERFEKAIEISLGKKLQNIVCEDSADAKRVIDYLKREKLGRITFLPLSNVAGRGDDKQNLAAMERAPGYLGKANELIEFDRRYETIFDHLLGRIVVVDTFDNGVNLLKIPQLKYKIVTLDGEILVPGGGITGGSFKSNMSNILSRRRQIEDLESSLVDLKNLYHDQMKSVDRMKTALEMTTKAYNEVSNGLGNNRIKIAETSGQLTAIEAERTRLLTEKDKIGAEQQTISKQMDLANERIEKKLSDIEASEKEHSALTATLSQENDSMKHMTDEIELFKEKITGIQIEMAALEEKLNHATSNMSRIVEEKAGILEKERLDVAELSAAEGQARTFDETMKHLVERIAEESLFKVAYDEKRLAIEAEKEQSAKALHDKQIQIQGHSKDVLTVKDTLHKGEVTVAKYEVEKESIIREIWEKYELSIIEALKLKSDQHKDDIKEIRNIKKMLKDIGDVNLGAIAEYEEVKTRYDFLSAQREDLQQAQRSLKKVIRELENVMKQQFVENFEVVRGHFMEIFSSLFTGGKADLILDDLDNVLESDVQILAQPPGKKLQDLSLMSGGEKALTAIALLFAILKTKPAPFCILDEIEAALDDVNVVRFADFLEHFTRKSQFVVITHRKGTMEIADVLYGVTMEEHGVSKVVSMQLEDI
ncbi:MAG: chromosome segregation protein SMC [Clostridia bacterium]|nr:chromosome segregation protein SMC [Clostridia bacterium]